MSTKKAQSIANQINDRLGITLTSYQNSEIEWLKSELESFLDLEIETDDLEDPDDCELDPEDLEEEE